MSPKVITDEDIKQRELHLIEIARQLVEQDCTTTLTMDKLVKAAPYSKGTIYKHFISKEDLLMAICNSCMEEIKSLFERALTFEGNSREKVLAVAVSYVIWAKLHPSQLFAVLSAHAPSVALGCSSARNQCQQQHEFTLMELMNTAIEKAIAGGNFELPENLSVEQVNFAMWSSLWGALALIMSKGESAKLKSMILERESFTNSRLLLDGLNWRPLSSDWDYSQSMVNIVNTLFVPEIKALEEKGNPFIYC